MRCCSANCTVMLDDERITPSAVSSQRVTQLVFGYPAWDVTRYVHPPSATGGIQGIQVKMLDFCAEEQNRAGLHEKFAPAWQLN